MNNFKKLILCFSGFWVVYKLENNEKTGLIYFLGIQ
jgi:hypothetical protein